MALWAFYYWWKKDRHTRERFAFYGFGALLGFGFFYLASLSLNTSIITGLASILLKPFGIKFQSSPLTPLEALLFFCLIAALIYAYVQIFKHWDGQKSTAQYEQEQNRIAASVLSDILRILRKDTEKLAPYQEQTEQQISFLERPSSLAWHDQARQLWLLHQRTYIFDEEYNPARKCWLGQKKDTGALALLICQHDALPENEIRELGRYAQEVAKARQCKEIEIILAIKRGQETSRKIRTGYVLHQVTEASLLEGLVDFSDYFADLRYRVEHMTLLDSDLTLHDTYTSSNYSLTNYGRAISQSIEDFILEWLKENSRRQLALLGEYGQGKSTTALLFSYHLIERAKTDNCTRIPILIELRGKSPRTLTPEDLLATWAYRYGINPQALLHLHISGRILLIFEGFDEIDLTGDTEIRISHFRTLWRLNYERAKIIITGRPNFFLDDHERKRALGIEEQTQIVYLAPFNLYQIDNSLRAIDSQTRMEIVELADKNKKFKEIVSRPSLLYVVATLWKKEDLSAKREQINSAFVMNLFIHQTLQRQQFKHDERPFMALNTAERAYFMAGIAAYMAANNLPNQINKTQLDEVVKVLVKIIPDSVSQNVTVVQDENSYPLKSEERFNWKSRENEILQKISNDVRSCGLLVTDLSKDGAFKFAHKSFMEFLQAQIISQLFSNSEKERILGNSISNTWALKSYKLQSSEEAFSFLIELFEISLKKYGLLEEKAIASGLLYILVIDILPSRLTLRAYLKQKMVLCEIWLTDKLIKYVLFIKEKVSLLRSEGIILFASASIVIATITVALTLTHIFENIISAIFLASSSVIIGILAPLNSLDYSVNISQKQLKQRLLGAAILIALAVIIIPELVKKPTNVVVEYKETSRILLISSIILFTWIGTIISIIKFPGKKIPPDKRPILVGGVTTLILLVAAFLLSPVVSNETNIATNSDTTVLAINNIDFHEEGQNKNVVSKVISITFALTIGFIIGRIIGKASDFLYNKNNFLWQRLNLWFHACHSLQLSFNAIRAIVGERIFALLKQKYESSKS